MEDAISILRGLRERLEVFHGVKIQDGALVAAVTLSHRYISDRFLPDKAIDLVDEACAMLRTEIDSMPAELDELTRRVTRLEIEEAALAKEEDAGEQGPAGGSCARSWPTCEPRPTPCAPSGRPSATALRKVQALREEIEQVRQESEQAERDYDLNRAASLRHGKLPELERRLEAAEARLAGKQGGHRLLREVVTEDEIADDRVALDRHPGHAGCRRASARSCCASTRSCTSGSSARTRRSSWWPTRSSGPAPASRTRVGRSARSSSSAPPASARPSWPRRWRRPCSTPRRTWSAST